MKIDNREKPKAIRYTKAIGLVQKCGKVLSSDATERMWIKRCAEQDLLFHSCTIASSRSKKRGARFLVVLRRRTVT